MGYCTLFSNFCATYAITSSNGRLDCTTSELAYIIHVHVQTETVYILKKLLCLMQRPFLLFFFYQERIKFLSSYFSYSIFLRVFFMIYAKE